MRRTLLISLLTMAAFILPTATYAKCSPSTIEIDGAYEDWADCETLVNDSQGELSNMQYWDVTSNTWITTDPGYDTWTFDDAAMIDVKKVKILNDNKNMYFYMENNWPMMSIQAPDGTFYDMMQITSQTMELLENYDFVPSTMPSFDHWMVWSFDKDLDGVYDYYFGAHLLSSFEQDESGTGLVVYKDSDGNGTFDADLDEKLADMSADDSKTSMDNAIDPDALKFEIQQNIEVFYEETGIAAGDTVKIRMETHSDTGDTTKGKRYTFDLNKPAGLTAVLDSANATLNWDKVDAAKKYKVFVYSKDKEKLATYKVKKDTSLVVNNLTANKKYYFRVRGLTKNGDAGMFSQYKSFRMGNY